MASMKNFFFDFATFNIDSNSALLTVTGFSQRTCLLLFKHAMDCSLWNVCGVQYTPHLYPGFIKIFIGFNNRRGLKIVL